MSCFEDMSHNSNLHDIVIESHDLWIRKLCMEMLNDLIFSSPPIVISNLWIDHELMHPMRTGLPCLSTHTPPVHSICFCKTKSTSTKETIYKFYHMYFGFLRLLIGINAYSMYMVRHNLWFLFRCLIRYLLRCQLRCHSVVCPLAHDLCGSWSIHALNWHQGN